MPRRPKDLHSLKRPRIRQDWNPITLYHLSQFRAPKTEWSTYFQQKWTAKGLARAYHGEHIPEKKWAKMFTRTLPAVVPMDYKELARSDGSDYSMGRGSGLDVDEDVTTSKGEKRKTPYMQMIFHPLERRLETAIFRALFASSIRQARMLCIHGHVTVNGHKMRHPSYTLNPGDLFSVSPKWVMHITGDKTLSVGSPSEIKSGLEGAKQLLSMIKAKIAAPGKAVRSKEAKPRSADSEKSSAVDAEQVKPVDNESAKVNHKAMLDIRNTIKELLDTHKESMPNKQKQALRALRTDISQMMSKKSVEDASLAGITQRFRDASAGLAVKLKTPSPTSNPTNSSSTTRSPSPYAPKSDRQTFVNREEARQQLLNISHLSRYVVEQRAQFSLSSHVAADHRKTLILCHALLASSDKDALDPVVSQAIHKRFKACIKRQFNMAMEDLQQKMEADLRPELWSDANPYEIQAPAAVSAIQKVAEASATEDAQVEALIAKHLTPWRPRPYLSAFAFIPRYLEVNQNVCSAVYLRHPVARPGLAEVPTPFPEGLSQLVFNWYLRKR